jgi:hypothetical protein
MASLSEHKYTVFFRDVVLYATSGSTTQGVVQFAGDSCQLTASRNPPCILYFRQALKARAAEVRHLVRSAQVVPEERINYVDPMKLEDALQELLQKSGVDIVVVLSG